MPEITLYETEDGRAPFAEWFDSLNANAAAKVTTSVTRMGLGNFGDHKSVKGGVWELRIHFEKGYRLYYAKDGEDIVLLLAGGTKSRQKADIENAKQYLRDYKQRKTKELPKQKPQTRKKNEERISNGINSRFQKNR
ncbi:MAG: type II toxin-antitoxin system RelE/ParE family toxin [Planctomycetaceae bacterium]